MVPSLQRMSWSRLYSASHAEGGVQLMGTNMEVGCFSFALEGKEWQNFGSHLECELWDRFKDVSHLKAAHNHYPIMCSLVCSQKWNIAHQWTFRITPKGYDSEITCDKMNVTKMKKLLSGCDFFRLNQVPQFQELSVLMLQITGTIHYTWLMRHEKGYCYRKGPFLSTTI